MTFLTLLAIASAAFIATILAIAFLTADNPENRARAPQRDAFETWWNARPISYEIMCAKPRARMVWDAAVKSTEQEKQ